MSRYGLVGLAVVSAICSSVRQLEDAPLLADGRWQLTEWRDAVHRDAITTLTIRTQDGKKTATTPDDELFKWDVRDVAVRGRLLTFSIGRDEYVRQFEGVLNPKNPLRVLGSLLHAGSVEGAQLDFVGDQARAQELETEAHPPERWEELIRLIAEDFGTKFEFERARLRESDAAKKRALEAASAEAAKQYDEHVPKRLCSVYEMHQGTPLGYAAAMTLVEQAARLKASADEIKQWAGSARRFAVTHGPRFEAATMGRIAVHLVRPGEYDELAREFAVEADRLEKASGLTPLTWKSVVAYLEERAAWRSGPMPPADEPWPATVHGRVTDEQGRPLEGALVQVNNLQWVSVVRPPSGFNTRTDKNGRYSMTLKCDGTFRLHVTRMWAEKSGFVRTVNADRHKISPGGAATVDFVLKPGEVFGGTVKLRKNPRKKADSDPLMILELIAPDYQQHVEVKHGEFEVFVPPGSYEVRLDAAGKKLKWTGLKSGRRDHVLEQEPFEFNPESMGAAFDNVWRSMNFGYSYFFLKPDVDWKALRDTYRPRACAAKNADQMAAVLQEMLAHLKDGHVWIEREDGTMVGTHKTTWNYNGNRQIILAQLTDIVECGDFAVVGKTKQDGFGYFLMKHQSAATAETVAKAIAAIEALHDTPGFIVDLRQANGGNESFALDIAQRFCEEAVVYAKSKYRNGSDHDAFTQTYPRTLSAPKKGKPYLKPVVSLIGPGCVSSGEGFAKMMRALPHVTTVGLPTRGSSGNPAMVEAGETGIRVYYSNWVDMLPDGTPIEGKGVPPDILVNVASEAYRTEDPTLAAGLAVLKDRIVNTKRKQ
jgi:hypothetical protein